MTADDARTFPQVAARHADQGRFLTAVIVSLVRRMEALVAAFEDEGVDPALLSRIRAVLDGER